MTGSRISGAKPLGARTVTRALTVALTVAAVMIAALIAPTAAPHAAEPLGPPLRLVPVPLTAAPPLKEKPPSASEAAANTTPPNATPGLWTGQPSALIARLVAELPVAAPSPVQRRLTLALLTGGSPLSPGTASPGTALSATRAAKLVALGEPALALRLLAGNPNALNQEATARIWVQAQLVAAPESLDCPSATRLAQTFKQPLWDRVTLYCRLLAKEHIDTPTSAATSADGPFDRLVALAGEAPGAVFPTTLVKAEPDLFAIDLDLALIRLTGSPFPADTALLKDPGRLALVARSDVTDPDLRAAAAERAAAAGALGPTELAAAYAAVRFSPAELARPLSSREKGARGRALIDQALVQESQGAVRAELIRRGLELLEPVHTVGPVAAVPLAALEGLAIDPTTLWLAPRMIQAFYAQGRPEAAAPWRDAQPTVAAGANPNPNPNPIGAGTTDRLWPLALLATNPQAPGASAADLRAWLDRALRDADGAQRARISGFLALLQAAGEPVPADAWTLTADRADGTGADATPLSVPSPALSQGLTSAAEAGRGTETLLIALSMLGDGGPHALPPVILAQIVGALRSVGWLAEARALAREAVAEAR